MNIENKQLTGGAFVNLRNAFDTVDHEIFISKFVGIGRSEESVKWFKSYLSDREQITNFKGKKSHYFIIKMPNCTSNVIIDMYADDTTLSVSGSTAHEVEQKLMLALNEVMTFYTTIKTKDVCHVYAGHLPIDGLASYFTQS